MKLTKINNLLLLLIILIDSYIILAPILPSLLYHFQAARRQQLQAMLKVPLAKYASNPVAVKPQLNKVIIPAMDLNQPIVNGPESQQYKILDRGSIWRFSWGSTPDIGGNTVLVGHRFTYTNPRGVFYFMNKVQLGDPIGVIWNNRQYNYTVTSISEVPPTDTSIEARSIKPELTLFTCTPLWLPKDRLVVVADLEDSR